MRHSSVRKSRHHEARLRGGSEQHGCEEALQVRLAPRRESCQVLPGAEEAVGPCWPTLEGFHTFFSLCFRAACRPLQGRRCVSGIAVVSPEGAMD